MKWISAIQKPYKAALFLFIVMISVILFNLLNRKQMRDINSSVASIYHDRLVPASDIFHVTEYLYQKRFLLENHLSANEGTTGVQQQLASLDLKIRQLITRYEKTYLVKEERKNLADLKKNLENYQLYESAVLRLHGQSKEIAVRHYHETAAPVWQESIRKLSALNDLQATVGNELLKSSGAIQSTSQLFSWLQMIVALIMGTIVIALAANSRLIDSARGNYKWN